jgi:hypothetical protein
MRSRAGILLEGVLIEITQEHQQRDSMSDCDSDIESGGTKTVYHGRIKIYGGQQLRISQRESQL